MKGTNFYSVLQITPDAIPEVVSAAHKALIRKVHPDLPGGGDSALFRAYQEAYDTLSDVVRRHDYDRDRAAAIREEPNLKGRYRILKQIAEGAMGITYLAEHRTLGERVCIKHCVEIAPEYTDIMLAEARSVWDLRHFGLPIMRDVFIQDDGSVALVMSFIDGLTIEQICEKIGGPMDPEDVAWITDRLLNTLMYLHYNGVVHGDVKPQNIIVTPDTHMVTLVDFGLATVRPRANVASKGYTKWYAAPELEAGGTPLPESDLYCLGLVMLYALTGSHERVRSRLIPKAAPEPLKAFIRSLIVRDLAERPHWKKGNLCETFRTVRVESFGRAESGMRPIKGLTL